MDIAHVGLEISLLNGTKIAERARERLLPCVCLEVLQEVVLVEELSSAERAHNTLSLWTD